MTDRERAEYLNCYVDLVNAGSRPDPGEWLDSQGISDEELRELLETTLLCTEMWPDDDWCPDDIMQPGPEEYESPLEE